MRLPNFILASLILGSIDPTQAEDGDVSVKYHGVGFVQAGRVEKSSDLVSNGPVNNFNKNWIQAGGGHIASTAKIGPNWAAGFGLGTVVTHNARGSLDVANNWYPYWITYISEAKLTHNRTFSENHALQIQLGFFPYTYNSEVRDLGAYLLRGYVYPGTLVSGFEARGTTGAASIFGGMLGYTFGGFKNDLILISETENRPNFDFSVADVITWTLHPSLQLGAGANFYRVLPRKPKNTSPDKSCDNTQNNYNQIIPVDNEICYVLDTLSLDTVAKTARVDTVLGSLAGTKLMGRLRFDPKAALGIGGPFGKQDLVVYSEVAILGLEDYAKYYTDIKRRIPVMVGFNFPAFGLLDKLSLEVEYYASKNFADYGKAQSEYSWVPRVVSKANNKRDDWKWALYASRVVFGQVKLSGQIANDHLRTFGPPDVGSLTYAETLTTPKDWYWMTKLAFFF